MVETIWHLKYVKENLIVCKKGFNIAFNFALMFRFLFVRILSTDFILTWSLPVLLSLSELKKPEDASQIPLETINFYLFSALSAVSY